VESELKTNAPRAEEPASEVYDDGFGYETEPSDPVQVSSLIAIIRIIAVLGMGLCISFGLFISLVGVTGLIIGVPTMLLAVPLFFGMQYAEKWAQRNAPPVDSET
jgi:hypothetical protein